MEKIPQKLDKTRQEYYASASIAEFGVRKPELTSVIAMEEEDGSSLFLAH